VCAKLVVTPNVHGPNLTSSLSCKPTRYTNCQCKIIFEV